MFKTIDYIFFILTIIITILLYQFADREIARYFYNMPHNEIKEFFHFMTRFGKSEWYLIPSILLFWYFRKKQQTRYATMTLYLFITNVVAGVGVWFIKVPFGRMRPEFYLKDNLYGFEWFEINHKLTSFPSGHTITAISTAVALSLLFPKWKYIFIPFGIIIALSRVVGSNHFMSDVVFASFLGTMVATVLYKYYFPKESL
ncbi:MAG TPA: phosphatase PAP2 family protein [Campylobacterales bacterium]|nr:phosphatase PAP2 family protein [Campylobacterales bacterium]